MRVAMTLYKPGSCAEYQVIVDQSGVHNSALKKFVYLFCRKMAIVAHDLIQVPALGEA